MVKSESQVGQMRYLSCIEPFEMGFRSGGFSVGPGLEHGVQVGEVCFVVLVLVFRVLGFRV